MSGCMSENKTEKLVDVLSYCQDTGALTWKVTRGSRAIKGCVAGGVGANGYLVVKVFGRLMYAHRIAFEIFTGREPREIDHINGIKRDNRWLNIREVSHRENSMNQPRPNTNTSGFIGVTWDGSRVKWQAQIHVKGKLIFLGRFENIKDAVSARAAAEEKYGFHENHGRDGVDE